MWNFIRRNFTLATTQEDFASTLQQYGKALQFVKQKNYPSAQSQFQNCLHTLQKQGLYGQPTYNFILRRIALLQRSQNKQKETQKTLQQIVVNYKATQSTYPLQLSNSYQILFKQYLQSNIVKALKLGKFLLKEKNWNSLQNNSQKDIMFLLAVKFTQTGYSLAGFHKEAKQHYIKCFDLNPGGNYCFVLHNLATSQWLHMAQLGLLNNPLQSGDNSELLQARFEYSEAIPNFRKALQLFEGKTELFSPDSEDSKLENKLSGLSLTNLAEILFQEGEIEVIVIQEAMVWLRCSLKFYQDVDKAGMGRALLLSGIYFKSQGMVTEAQSVIQAAFSLLEHVSYMQREDYNTVLMYELLGSLKIGEQREVQIQKAKELAKKLPFWAERAVNFHVPTWHL